MGDFVGFQQFNQKQWDLQETRNYFCFVTLARALFVKKSGTDIPLSLAINRSVPDFLRQLSGEVSTKGSLKCRHGNESRGAVSIFILYPPKYV
jgi:hypothetical protein